MELPFQAGDPVVKPLFYDREELLEELFISLRALKTETHQDFALIAPRRTGKSSILKMLEEKLREEKIAAVYIDCSKSLPEATDQQKIEFFLEQYFKQTLNAYSEIAGWRVLRARITEAVKGTPEAVQLLIKNLGIEIGVELKELFTLWMRFKGNVDRDFKALIEKCLQLPELLAVQTGIPCVVFLDEFQELCALKRDLSWYLRSVIQHHKHVAYVITGSNVYLMNELTMRNKRSAFYNLFMIRKLDPFTDYDSKNFLKKRIKVTGMHFTEAALNEILVKTRNIPFYLQWLGLHCYFIALHKKTKEINEDIVREAYSRAISQLPQLEQELAKVSGRRKEILVYLALNTLTSPAKIARALQMKEQAIVRELNALVQLDYLKKIGRGKYEFQDEVFREWLNNKYTA